MQAEQLKKITGYFIEEAKEHLETIEQGIAHLQETIDDSEQVTEVYRAAHSIKGGAAMLELESIRKTAHRLEDYFKILKEHPRTVDPQLAGYLNPIYRGLQTLVADLEQNYAVSSEVETQVMTTIEPLFEPTKLHLESPKAAAKAPSTETDARSLTNSDDFLENLVTSDFTIERGHNDAKSDLHKSSPSMGSAELSTLANLFEADGTDIDQTLADTDSDLQLLSELTGGDFTFDADERESSEEVDDLLSQLMDSAELDRTAETPEMDDDLAFLDEFSFDEADSPSLAPETELSSSLDSLEALFSSDFESETAASRDHAPQPPAPTVHPRIAHPDDRQILGQETDRDLDSLFSEFAESEASDLFDTQTAANNSNLGADTADLNPLALDDDDLGFGDLLNEEEATDAESAALLDDLFAAPNNSPEAAAEPDLAELFAATEASQAASPEPALGAMDDTALDDLLSLGNLPSQPYHPPHRATPDSENSDDNLDRLLDDVAAATPPERPAAKPASTPHPAAPSQPQPEVQLHYYDRLEDLESLLAQSPSWDARESSQPSAENDTLFSSLESLLDRNPSLETPLSVNLSPENTLAATEPVSNTDDEFGDLEELLKDFEAQVGGPPSTPGKRPSRPRTRLRNNVKVEQTLKVPVKQMDNLSNLVGELVVKPQQLRRRRRQTASKPRHAHAPSPKPQRCRRSDARFVRAIAP
jgi:chemotaxis protein histidine kinase CheA